MKTDNTKVHTFSDLPAFIHLLSYNPIIDKISSPDRHAGELGRKKRTRTEGNVMAVRPNHPSSVFSLLVSTNSGGPVTRLTFLSCS